MKELHKRALKEVYEIASEAQKEALIENFPEVFELQNGVWYTYTDFKGYLIKFTDVDKRLAFGLSALSGWQGKSLVWGRKNLVEAKPREIEELLKGAAEAKGLTDGQRIIDGDAFYTIKGDLYYSHIDDALHDENDLPIFGGREWPRKAPARARMSKEAAGELFNIEIID